jgi:hypothetical protein
VAYSPGVAPVSRVSAQYKIGTAFSQTATLEVSSNPFLGEWLYPLCDSCWSFDSASDYVDGQDLSDQFDPIPSTKKYQWYRNGVAIKGATYPARQVDYDDLGASLQLVATYSSPGYEVITLRSNVTSPVLARSFSATQQPTISNTSPKFGDVLSASIGDWDPVVDDYFIQWYRNGDAIPKAWSSTYKIGISDIGSVITVGYTGYLYNFDEIEIVSEPTVAVAPGDLSEPSEPIILGSQSVGSTLSFQVGSFPSGVRLSYQWYNSELQPISGATKTTYKVRAEDTDQQLTVRVTGTKAGYNNLVLVSAPTAPIQQSAFTLKPAPKIIGQVCMYCTLSAKLSGWSQEPEFSFQWLRDGVPIEGATLDSYDLTEADGGHKISFIQTASGDSSGRGTVVASSNVLSNWVVKTAKYTISGEEFVDNCDDEEGYICYYDDCECGWGLIDSDYFDVDADDFFYKIFDFDLGRTPISWSASFTGNPRDIPKWRGTYVENGSFWYYAEGPNDTYGSYTQMKQKNNKNWTSAKSSLHDGTMVSFGLGSDDTYATINFRYFIITYTYYQ